MIYLLRLLRLTLATWRITSLLVQERGPYALLLRLREHHAGTEVGKALECVWCTSVYAAVFILILDQFLPELVDVFALSAGAILYDKHASN
jgi:hypothetical protein